MRTTTVLVFAMVFCGAGLRAQEPAQPATASLQKVFSNLGPSTSAYYPEGWSLSGPSTGLYADFLALPFTPKAHAHVSVVLAAIGYSSGTNQINLSLYSDYNGVPGSLLAGPVTVANLPSYGSCCELAAARFPSSVAVSAGIQYWIVADTPPSGAGSDFQGGWQGVNSSLKFGISPGSGWFPLPGNAEPAGAAYGTIP